jgi:hypothetical protein
LRFCRRVDPWFRPLLSMSADEPQGFNDWCEEQGQQEKIGIGLEVGEGSGKLRPGPA